MAYVGTPTTAYGAAVTAAGSANTKGTWVELEDSAPFDVHGILLLVRMSELSRTYLLDIGTGAAASEAVLIANIFVTGGAISSVVNAIYLPIKVASGTRIAARVQSATASAAVAIRLILYDTTSKIMPGCARATTYGADTSDSGGVSADPGAVANTRTQVELVASVTNDIQVLVSCSGFQPTNGGTMVHEFDFATGAGAGTKFLEYLMTRQHATYGTSIQGLLGPFPVSIAAGTRVSTYIQASATATGRVQDFVLLGFDQQDTPASNNFSFITQCALMLGVGGTIASGSVGMKSL